MDGEAPYAGLLGRLLAYLVDALLLTGILFAACLVFRAAFGPALHFESVPGLLGSPVKVDRIRWIAVAVLSAALNGAYFIGSWTARRATPGQRLLGIRVGRAADRCPLGIGPAAARWLLLMGPLSLGAVLASLRPGLRASYAVAVPVWYGVLLLTTAWSRTRQGLHDRSAGSVVTPVAKTASPSRQP
jgi:uncharacterized RDD family membrane protein YckC